MNKNKLKLLLNKINFIQINCNYAQNWPKYLHYSCSSGGGNSSGRSVVPNETKVLIYGNDLTTLSIAYHLSEAKYFGNNCIVITGNKRLNNLDSNVGSKADNWINSCHLSHLNVSNPRQTQLIQYSSQLYDINTTGALYLAPNQQTLDSFVRRISSAKLVFSQDICESIEMLSKDEIKKRFADILAVEDIVGALYVPNDGLIEDLSGQQLKLRQMSEKNGIKFFDNLLLNKININNNKVSNVELIDCQTNSVKRIDCRYFVNCTNNYLTRIIAKRSVTRVRIPTLCIHNQVMVTKPFDGRNSVAGSTHKSSLLPIIHDFGHKFTVYQTSDRALCLTGYEKVSKILQKNLAEKDNTGAINVEIPQIPENWDDFYRILNPILKRMPALSAANLHRLVPRLENFTPDGRALIGEVSEVRNYLLAAAVSPQFSAGAGHLITSIITKTDNSFGHDFWSLDPRRFISSQSNRIFLFDRLREIPAKARYNLTYPYPHNDYRTGHGLRISPIYPRVKEAGALFSQIMAYERPAVYMSADEPTDDWEPTGGDEPRHRILKTETFGRPHWLDTVQQEYQACRERVALLDYCSFSKLELRSPNDEVLQLLQYLCSNDVDHSVGSIVHTGMQNERGGYENDVSLIRLAPNRFMLVGPTEQQSRCISWLKSHNMDANVQISDISGQYTALCVMGPLSKMVLSEVLSDPHQLEVFPFFTFKELVIGLAPNVRVCNLTHTGELGWVLYIPNEYAVHVYEQLVRIGRRYEMRHVGSIAMRTLRIEKFFAFWGQDLDTTTTPFECGRSFRVKFDKEFLGKNALLKQKAEGVRRRYVQLLLEDFDFNSRVWPWGGEPIFICDSEFDSRVPIGVTTTTGYGFTLQRHVCLGYIRHPDNQFISNEFILKSRFEVEIGGQRVRARTNLHSPKLTDVSGSYLATR